jgi:ABC-type glycerol-3-phosphate transport system permease component
MNKLSFRRQPLSLILRWAGLGFFAFLTLYPLIWMFSTALKSPAEVITRISASPLSPEFWPTVPWLKNFSVVWQSGMGRGLFNSFFLSVVTVLGLLATTLPAAYAFARLEFSGKKTVFSLVLATLMIPETVTFIPNFLTVAAFHWVDTWQGMTVPLMANAFYIFFLYQYIRQLPQELFDAGVLDGATHFQMLCKIVVPLLQGPLATMIFLEVLASWNSLLWPLLISQSETWRPVSVVLARFTSEEGSQMGLRMAASLFAILPLLTIFVVLQRRITETLVRSGIR